MSKFHSTVNRRDFMKALGLAGAGLGAAAATAPAFRDLDEFVTSNSSTHQSQKWWVKDRDIGDITTPVDWGVFKEYDRETHPATPREFGPGGPVLVPHARRGRARAPSTAGPARQFETWR